MAWNRRGFLYKTELTWNNRALGQCKLRVKFQDGWLFNKLKKTAVKLENMLNYMVTMGTYELTHELTRSLTAAVAVIIL